MSKRLSNFFKYIAVLIAIIYFSSSNAQTLHPDSLMVKMEELGDFLLYRNHDSAYITSFGENFTFKLIGVSKFNYFRIKDSELNSSARYRPDRRLNLGFGLSYKWFAFDLAFNLGIGEDSQFKNSKFMDLSATIFSSKQFISGSYQYYYGYQMSKFTGIIPEEVPSSSIRDDIRTIYFGLEYIFVLSYDKFSLKSSFIHNERQKKSAGSFCIGANLGLLTIDADSTIIPPEFYADFNENLHLTDLNATFASIGFGYIYTLILKKYFYVTLSFIPGAGINYGDYKTVYRSPYKTSLYLGFKTMNSIGYNGEQVFCGLQFSNDSFRTRIAKQQGVISGHGKAKIFVGYRFNSKKKKR